MEGEAINCALLRPDPCPLDSRSPIGVEDKLHGNDIHGCRISEMYYQQQAVKNF